MSTLNPLLTHLAFLIDRKEERLEKTTIPFLRKQLHAELEELSKRFRAEYLVSTGRTNREEMWQVAA